jgi:hypothetical protein
MNHWMTGNRERYEFDSHFYSKVGFTRREFADLCKTALNVGGGSERQTCWKLERA